MPEIQPIAVVNHYTFLSPGCPLNRLDAFNAITGARIVLNPDTSDKVPAQSELGVMVAACRACRERGECTNMDALNESSGVDLMSALLSECRKSITET